MESSPKIKVDQILQGNYHLPRISQSTDISDSISLNNFIAFNNNIDITLL